MHHGLKIVTYWGRGHSIWNLVNLFFWLQVSKELGRIYLQSTFLITGNLVDIPTVMSKNMTTSPQRQQ